MSDIRPLGEGRSTRLDSKTIEATFALSEEMTGWKMASSSIDETGYFLTIRWEKLDKHLMATVPVKEGEIE